MRESTWEEGRRLARLRIRNIMGWNDTFASERSIDQYVFTMTEKHRELERLYPGCTVAWDVNPATRQWVSAHLKFARSSIRNFANSVMKRQAVGHHLRMQGHYTLLAIQENEHGTEQRVEAPYQWQKRGRSIRNFASIRAVYVPTEGCWVVIR